MQRSISRHLGTAAALGVGALLAASMLVPLAYAQSTQSGGTVPNSGGSTQSGGTVQNPNQQTGPIVTLYNPLSAGTNLEQFIQDLLALVIRIGSIIIIFMLIYVGYLFVTAQGEPSELSHAREALKWTVVGALILLGAQAIASGIQATVQAISQGH